jgi:hypothetical protein
MSNSISSTSHASDAQSTVPKPSPKPAKESSTSQATKSRPLPPDKVSLSSHAPNASSAKTNHNSDRE